MLFTIKEKFKFLDSYIELVINKKLNSLIITGTSGVGKTWNVKRKITEMNADVFYVKGYSTPRALYDTLYKNRNKLLVFDDCDSIMEDKVAINILKGALDSYDDRVISWISKTKDKSIPSQFNFQGQVIFISNLKMEDLDKAILSRALKIDLTMTYDEKKELMASILNDIKPEVDFFTKSLAFSTLVESTTNEDYVNIRTLEQAITLVENFPNDYEAQIRFMLTTL